MTKRITILFVSTVVVSTFILWGNHIVTKRISDQNEMATEQLVDGNKSKKEGDLNQQDGKVQPEEALPDQQNANVQSQEIHEPGARMQKADSVVNTSKWLIEKNGAMDFSFRYPQDAKMIYEGNCYRVEYELGFVIFFIPVDVEGEARCGLRTGVDLTGSIDVNNYLTIGGEEYEAQGFQISVDTKEEKFFDPETRYFYDFHYVFDLNKNKNCRGSSECGRIAYGIYKNSKTPLDKRDIDTTMSTLRAIIESVSANLP